MSKNNYNAKKLKNTTVLSPNTIVTETSNTTLADTTLENVIITSGTINNVQIGNLYPNTIVASSGTLGNITFNNSTISTNNNSDIVFDKTIIYKTIVPDGERLIMNNSFLIPSNAYNLTMISVTADNVQLSGTLLTPVLDFFEKQFVVESLGLNSTISFNFPINKLCSSEGCKAAQTLTFTCPGQGLTLIYSSTADCWYIKNSGATITYWT